MSGTRSPAGGKRRRGSKDGVPMSIGKVFVEKVGSHRTRANTVAPSVNDEIKIVFAAGPVSETVLPQERTSGAIDWTAERRKTQAFLADLDESAQAATRREAREGVRFGTL